MGRRLVIAIDFDGTIVEAKYPEIGELRKDARSIINELFDAGHKIIINTCRTGDHEDQVIEFLRLNGIKCHEINNNIPELIEKFGTDSRKISADIYIDDKNLGGICSWQFMYGQITELLRASEFNGRQLLLD